MSVGVKVDFIQLTPVNPASVPNGCVFLDASNGNVATVKSTGGTSDPVGNTSSDNLFIKQMQIDGPIEVNKPVSKKANGRIVQGDSDSADGQMIVGMSLEAGLNAGDFINVFCIGANLAGALAGLGMTPGQEVFLSETGGYTTDANSFTGNNDTIMKVGIADCAAGAASGTAVDLISFPEIVTRP